MSGCTLCPRRCGADRAGTAGVCRVKAAVKVARAAPHYGEEPCLSGERGSGAVFFAGCPLGCAYCQNYELSRGRAGEELTVEDLAETLRALERQGVHNLDMITGTQYAPAIVQALELARPRVPVVWNSSGYETEETVELLKPYVNVWLPDYKYRRPAPAQRYSRAPDYPAAAEKAILAMFRAAGPYELDDNGLLRSGVMIRHLVLPGQVENTLAVIDWVSRTFHEGDVLFSLMAQFTPCGETERFPELARPLTQEEWDTCLNALEDSDITEGYVQELGSDGTEQIPAFDGAGVVRAGTEEETTENG